MIIHYRPLANRRDYESIRLPIRSGEPGWDDLQKVHRDWQRSSREHRTGRPDPIGDAVGRPPTIRVAGRGIGKTAAGEAWAREHNATIVGRPDPLGDQIARNGLRAFAKTPKLSQMDRLKDRAESRRARTTTEIPIAVDATLPAISAALERLKASLGRNGTAAQLLAVESIAKAVEGVRSDLRIRADYLRRCSFDELGEELRVLADGED